MRRTTAFALILALAVTACGGKHQNPVASDDELGTTHIQDDKPASYVTKTGDTLASIAARPEIYGDSELWPLIADANESALGAVSSRHKLDGGKVLSIPRSLSVSELDEARERARQVAASAKSHRTVKHPEAEAMPTKVSSKPMAAARPTAEPSPIPAKPVPRVAKSGGGMMPMLLLLLLVLAGLGAVLYVFSRKDKQDRA